MTMLLYHGTAAKNVPDILAHGIRPRGKRKGNWDHSVLSRRDAVYLSDAYPIYFAGIAAKDKDDLAVVEVDTTHLAPFALVPDEDYLEQATRSGNGPAPIDKPMAFRTRWYRQRLGGFSQYWKDSVEGLGNAAYLGTVPTSAITRVATLDHDTYIKLILDGMDPMISLLNYRLMGTKYRNYVHWLFGDELEPDPWDDAKPIGEPDPKFLAMLAQQKERKKLKHLTRDGIQLLPA
jgi:hypothetical protein